MEQIIKAILALSNWMCLKNKNLNAKIIAVTIIQQKCCLCNLDFAIYKIINAHVFKDLKESIVKIL